MNNQESTDNAVSINTEPAQIPWKDQQYSKKELAYVAVRSAHELFRQGGNGVNINDFTSTIEQLITFYTEIFDLTEK